MNTHKRKRLTIRLTNIGGAELSLIDDILRRYPKNGSTWTGCVHWSEEHQNDVMDIFIFAPEGAIADIRKHDKLKGHIVPERALPLIRQNGHAH